MMSKHIDKILRPRFILCLIFLWAGAALSSVSAAAAAAAPAAADKAERLKVVTTFTVLADMAAQVAGDAAQVVSITKPGAEIHGYEPTPHDLVQASDADLILSNGLNLEAWFEQFIKNLGSVPTETITETITHDIKPIPIAEGNYKGAVNPHAWMGLENGLIYIDNIAHALQKHDPKNAQTYQANADAYKAKLKAVLAPLKEQIDQIPPAQRWLVTCEGAFSYLAADFGLKELYLWPINADQIGTPQQVRKVIDGVRKHNIPAVFCESTISTAPAQQVARETDAIFGGVLYVDSLSEADGAVPSYLDLLQVTATTIINGLKQGLKPDLKPGVKLGGATQ